MNTQTNNYCVIMAGGMGSRLWPYSRKQMPKQFLDFLGVGRTLLQLTYDRFTHIIPEDHIFVTTNMHYRDLVREQLPMLADDHVLVESTWRNTAPSMAWATHYLQHVNAEANMIAVPSDQLILNEMEFVQDVRRAFEFVERHGVPLCLGMRPSRPETGYGYIQMGDEVDACGVCRVKSFTEKPEEDFAKMFMASGEFLWNTGLFVWNARTMQRSLVGLDPEMAEYLGMTSELSPEAEVKLVSQSYASCPSLSLDRQMLEQEKNTCVMPCNFGWVDFGTWQALYGAAEKDAEGNVVLDSKARLYNCHNNVVRVPKGKIAVLQDMDDCVVVDEGNVLMVCRRGEASTIRKMVNDVQLDFGEEYL